MKEAAGCSPASLYFPRISLTKKSVRFDGSLKARLVLRYQAESNHRFVHDCFR